MVSQYERGRAGYPPEAIAWICDRFGIGPGSDVLDLAAGTGNLTRPLLASGANVVAVEPLAEMRAAIAETDARPGTAEAIPLEDDSVDLVTVGQAFHWFEGARALEEIHRVLRRGGGLALVWNRGDIGVDWVAELDALVNGVRPAGVPSFRSEAWRTPFGETALFTPLEEQVFTHEVPADAESVRARYASVSFVAQLPDDRRETLMAEIDAVTSRLPERFPYPYRTLVYAATAL